MPELKRILCPIDFSEFAMRAYRYAYSMARHYGACGRRPLKRENMAGIRCAALSIAGYPTLSTSIDMEPPSTPSTGKVAISPCCFVAST